MWHGLSVASSLSRLENKDCKIKQYNIFHNGTQPPARIKTIQAGHNKIQYDKFNICGPRINKQAEQTTAYN